MKALISTIIHSASGLSFFTFFKAKKNRKTPKHPNKQTVRLMCFSVVVSGVTKKMGTVGLHLGGGFKYFLFSSLFGEMIQLD